MKKYIPILGIFLTDYPIKKYFGIFFVYQVSIVGITTYIISHFLFLLFIK